MRTFESIDSMSECCPPLPGAAKAYDLVVIGAGSAGFSAAITAAEQGAKVALVGAGTIGGTCVNVGCVPSKALIRAVESLHQARAASRFDGVNAAAEIHSWAEVVRQKDQLVNDLRRAKYENVLQGYDTITYHEGAGRVIEGGVEVGDVHLVTERVIIATGSRPAIPTIAGIESVPYLTSTTALELEALPKSMLVIGGGYIGAELAQMFSRAGVKVTLVFRSRLLPEGEPEIGEALQGYLSDEGLTVVAGVVYESITHSEAGVSLAVTHSGTRRLLTAESVLLTTGRVANSDGLGLAELGVRTSQNGGIVVDDRMRTTRPGVYAVGDVTGSDQFVYMAAYGARLAARNALNDDSLPYDNRAMPAVVFTDPQGATVGLTEAAARAAGYDVQTSTITLDHVPRALAARDTRGLIKLVADRGTRRLLGAHILAPEGSDSIQTAAIAIKCGMTVEQLGDTIFPYLTTVEGLKLAALAFHKDVTKLSCCAG